MEEPWLESVRPLLGSGHLVRAVCVHSIYPKSISNGINVGELQVYMQQNAVIDQTWNKIQCLIC